MSRQDRPLRIAILAHSTSPRGGVVHALELGEALVRLGHEAVVHAPDTKGDGFFRPTLCKTVSVAAGPSGEDVAEMVQLRVADYVRHFVLPTNRRFDVFHAQDSISGNVLAELKAHKLIARFARTVHHIDAFDDARLTALQARAIVSADRHFVVSRHWQRQVSAQYAVRTVTVGNGVDTGRFSRIPSKRDDALRARLNLGAGPIFLSVGGIEERKNTRGILHAFMKLHAKCSTAQLVIAGGASLLDHRAYQQGFAEALAASGLPARAVIAAGPMPQEDMPPLYRIAAALVFPSIKEGFGLVVLEAMASGLPVVTSRIAPFTEYLTEADAVWCDPLDVESIAEAMCAALVTARRDELVRRGAEVAVRHDWLNTACAHLDTYAELAESQYA